jgi:hypothetical protein
LPPRPPSASAAEIVKDAVRRSAAAVNALGPNADIADDASKAMRNRRAVFVRLLQFSNATPPPPRTVFSTAAT